MSEKEIDPSSAAPAAKKKVAKKAAKKTAKKAAKKIAKKAAEKAADTPAGEKPAKPKPEKTDKAPQAEQPKSSEDSAPSDSETPRMGRAPGGGRVKRDSRPEKDDSPRSERSDPSDRSTDDRSQNDRKRRGRGRNRNRNRNRDRSEKGERGERNDRSDQDDRGPVTLEGPPIDVEGMLELSPKGFGFLRLQKKDFAADRVDCFVPPEFVRKHGLRPCVWIKGVAMQSAKGPQLTEIKTVNGASPDTTRKLPHFDELKAVNPTRRISFEDDPDRHTTRVLDIVAPVARGQRGLIVSPPRSGKTTLLSHIAEALQEKYDEQIHLMILLVDERPEEVTEFKRLLPEAEIYASSNDQPHSNHTRLAELCIERAKRLVEAGQDVFVLMDSITRLARAYNGGGGNSGGGKKKRRGGGYQSGGIVAGALEMPRRLFAAARDTKTAGSLTILATALVQTNSKADELIFQEFKGTGNMELVLDRRIAEQYLFPAVDIFRSGTRREELIMPEHLLHKIHLIRRGLSGHKPEEAIQRLLYFIKKFPNNSQMLLEIKG